jgi:hypothetical protein
MADVESSSAPRVAPPARLEPLAHAEVLETLIGIKAGDHVCVLYEYSPLEQIPAVVAYLKEGLLQGEQCIYVADETPAEHILLWLRAEGVDIDSGQASGALKVWRRAEWRQPGLLDSIRKAAQVRQIVEDALAAGFSGVRIAVEMTWALNPDIPLDAVEHWEATSNDLLRTAPISAMCLYGRRRHSSEAMAAALRTHPSVLDAAGVRSNEHYGESRPV